MKTRFEANFRDFWECVIEKPNNVMMSLWIKRMMCFSTIWSMYYAYTFRAYKSMALFLLALVVWFIDVLITNKGVFIYVDLVCVTIISGILDSIFLSGRLGFASCFMVLMIAVIGIFLLGMFWGNILGFLNFLFMTVLFNIDSLDWIHRAYSEKFCERFPFMMISFLASVNFIVYGMNKYTISRRKYQETLNALIIKGKMNRADISLKILLTMFKAMAAKSPVMAKHSECTAEWTNRLAIAMGLHNGSKKRYYYAGLLHDIGKIGLPDSFWDKLELTDEEYEVYKQHVDIGNSIVQKLRLEEISDATLYHHEKWKGNGYKGLRGNEIPETARMVGVANFIARLLQKGCTLEEIKNELNQESGKAYDVRIVKIAINIIDEDIEREKEEEIFK